MSKINRVIPWFLIAALALCLAGNVFFKAWTSSFTHDESFTYNHYVTSSLYDILSYKVVSPNNHLLNTLLMKALSVVFGNSPFALRLPNLLAFLGYILFMFLLLRKLNPWLILPLFALVTCNPYMLDFFALARGNGLSLFFMAGSLYFFMRFTEKHQTGEYAWSTMFAVLAVLSHYTLLYYLLAIMMVANLLPFLLKYVTTGADPAGRGYFLRINLINLAAMVILALIMWGPVFKLTSGNQFFYGGESGFWKDTVGSLVETSIYRSVVSPLVVSIVKILIMLVIAAAAGLAVVVVAGKDFNFLKGNLMLVLFFILLILMTGFNLAQFHLLGTKLLIRRYGLLYVPPFMLGAGLLIVALGARTRLKGIFTTILYMFAFTITFHTLATFSHSTYLDWVYEKETSHVMTLLEKDIPPQSPAGSVALGITWLFEPTVNFYRDTRHLDWLKPVTRDGPGIDARYYYVVREDLLKIPLHRALPVILFDDGKTVLVRVK